MIYVLCSMTSITSLKSKFKNINNVHALYARYLSRRQIYLSQIRFSQHCSIPQHLCLFCSKPHVDGSVSQCMNSSPIPHSWANIFNDGLFKSLLFMFRLPHDCTIRCHVSFMYVVLYHRKYLLQPGFKCAKLWNRTTIRIRPHPPDVRRPGYNTDVRCLLLNYHCR